MTSVTLPSTSGPIHRVYSSVSEEITNSESDFESNHPIKRCLSTPIPYSCKKRRKQSTPIRISAADWDGESPSEGKQSETSPEPEPLQCSVCQQNFDYPDHLQNHIASAHSSTEVKKEPQEEPQHQFFDPYGTMRDLKFPRPELQMMNDLQTKDWMARSLTNANPMFMHLPQFSQTEGMQRQPIKIFNPDAYCELCNKEFCNKYFLKTHKANKHGIYTETSSDTSYPNSMPSYVRLPTTVPSDMQLKTEPQTSSNMINPISDMFPNPFSNKLSRISQLNKTNPEEKDNDNLQSSNSNSGSDQVPADGLPNGESSSPKTIENESTSYKSDQEGLYYVPTSNMSPGQIGFNKEIDVSSRLRKIGVMNPKAFCEICCKEYCNKYFLRTHKMKRHGIMIPDERDNKSDMQTSFHWNQANIQTSPLNLIKTEQMNSDRKTTSPSDISCDICEIKFQNASLAQLHNISVHSKLYSKETTETGEQTNEENTKIPDASNLTEKSANSENISEDLKKLQTMILQLNELKVEKLSATCSACNKEFESRYFLHAHMITEHGILLDEVADLERPDNSSNNNTMCDLCGKDVENVEQLKKHILECHPSLEANLNNIKEEFNPDKVNRMSVSSMQLSERRMSVSLTPTSSYCEICNKELCNKYFMKTHMQRMHGIEIENGAQIGGVVCDICNKELCSKYFLRVHKHNTHGIVEYGTSLLQPKKAEGENTSSLPSESDSALKPNDLADLSHRYFTHFTEVCKICSRRFRSTKWLKAHLLNDHGQAGAEKWTDMEQQMSQSLGQHSRTPIKTESSSPTLKIPNSGQDLTTPKFGLHNVLSLFGADETGSKIYQCGMCTFTTTLLPLLFVHERSHTQPTETGRMELKCPVCGQIFYQTELLQHHVFKQHPLFPLQSAFNGSESREASQTPDEETRGEDFSESSKNVKLKKKKKWRKLELTSEVEQSLNEISKASQMPVTYALPKSSSEEEDQSSKFVMQAFLMEEEAAERHVIPAVVFLPVLQKQPAPLSVTFTLTPA